MKGISRGVRILNIITRLESGGAPRAVINIIARLMREGYSIDLATGLSPDPELDLIGAARSLGIKVHVVPQLVRDISPFRDVMALVKLIKLIKKGRYQVIHCHTSKAGFIGRLAARLAGATKTVYSPHGTIFTGYFSRPKTWLFVLLERFAAKYSTRIVTLTANEIEQFLAHGIGDRGQYEYIYNGVDIDLLGRNSIGHEGKRKELGISGDDFVISCAGRLVSVKGQRYLIEAAAKLEHEAPNLKVILMGAGPNAAELRGRCRNLGMAERVFFLGQRDDVAAIMASSDLYVQPSLNEGLGLAIIEAMALGKAVVASRVGGIPEVVDDGRGGILVPPGDSDSLARAIMELYSDPQRRKTMGEAGFMRATETFSIEAAVNRTRGLYEKIINDSGSFNSVGFCGAGR